MTALKFGLKRLLMQPFEIYIDEYPGTEDVADKKHITRGPV